MGLCQERKISQQQEVMGDNGHINGDMVSPYCLLQSPDFSSSNPPQLAHFCSSARVQLPGWRHDRDRAEGRDGGPVFDEKGHVEEGSGNMSDEIRDLFRI